MAVVGMARMVLVWIWTLGLSFIMLVGSLFSPTATWRLVLRTWARGCTKIVGIRVDLENPEFLAGPAVFIANHTSMADLAFVPTLLPSTTQFIAKRELTRIPLLGRALVRGGGLVVDRSKPRRAVASIREGIRRLPSGWSVAVFPEGTRSYDGELRPFKKGAFHVARELGLPLVPIGAWGALDVAPKGALYGRPATVFVTVGEPITTEGWEAADMPEHVARVRAAVAACIERSRQRYLGAREVGA